MIRRICKNNLVLFSLIVCMSIVSIKSMDNIEYTELNLPSFEKYSETIIELSDLNGLPIGYIKYTLFPYEKIGVIAILKVADHQQRNGFGSSLFLAAMNDAKNKQIEKMEWLATHDSLPFYKRFGSKRTDLSGSDMSKNSYFPEMEFIFEQDGDAADNLKQYYLNKSKES